jgi:uncharacterized protein (DUF58 family)
VIPARRLIALACAVMAIGLGVSLMGEARATWVVAASLLAAGAGADAARVRRRAVPVVTRRLPASFPVGEWTGVSLEIHWRGPGRLDAQVMDHHPPIARVEGLPAGMQAMPGQTASLAYRVRLPERGRAAFGATELRIRSPWRLWECRRMCGEPAAAAVLPDFRPMTRYALLAVTHRTNQIGVRLRPRRGEGMELHHLREYRVGDTLRQIDWKATARTARLISREYRDERNQQVVFLLDCGRTMRAVDDGEPHFEHALRSVLLLAYVALRQGDAVGLLTFGGPERWFAPVKGRGAMKSLLDAVHDLETTTEAPDYLTAAGRLLVRQRRRALVVIVSNLRDDDSSDVAAAMRLLRGRHLVLLASLRETALDDELEKPIAGFTDARRRAAVHHYLAARRRAHAALRGRGLRFCDTAPRNLPVEMVNRYLDIKRTGAL